MERIPYTVIGGYLGAGKTTLLNHILRNNDGLRVAVIVNDFGNINIDAELITNQDGDTINLANGCICCSLAGGFIQALSTLTDMDHPPEHILVEASGVADPHYLSQYGHMEGLQRNGVIVVVDAETIQAKSRDKYIGKTVMLQLQGADLLLLNKVDLVDPEALKDLRRWLHDLVPDARVVDAAYGVIPLAILLGINKLDEPVTSASNHHDHDHEHDHDHQHHHHDDEYQTHSFTSQQPINGEAFRSFIAELPENILRAKGILYLQESPEKRHIFQLVGKRWSLTPDRIWGDEEPQSQIVWIGVKGAFEKENINTTLEKIMRGNNHD